MKTSFLTALSCGLILSSCSTPEKTGRALKGGIAGAATGAVIGGAPGAAIGAASGGALGSATATGDPKYGSYTGATPPRATSGNTNSRSSGSMGHQF